MLRYGLQKRPSRAARHTTAMHTIMWAAPACIPRVGRSKSVTRIASSPHFAHGMILHGMFAGQMPQVVDHMLHGACPAWASHGAPWAHGTGPEAAGMAAHISSRMQRVALPPLCLCLLGHLPQGASSSMIMQPCFACCASWHVPSALRPFMACSAGAARLCTHGAPREARVASHTWPDATARPAAAHLRTPYRLSRDLSYRPRPRT